jgi:hypothetical protein
MPLVAVVLSVALSAVALLHVYWAVRGVNASTAVPSRTDGTPVFRPGRVATLTVAAALVVAALLVLARAHVVTIGLPTNLIDVGVWLVAATFTMRTVGEFRYVGIFKRVRGTPFARWDTRLFTPLCAAIASAAVVVAVTAR